MNVRRNTVRDLQVQNLPTRQVIAGCGRVLLLLFVLCGHQTVLGQTEAEKPGSQSTVTAETIESLRKRVADSADLDAETKQKIEAACVQALDGLKRIAELSQRADQYKRDVENVQERVTTLKQRLRQLQADRKFSPPEMTLVELEQEVSRREGVLAELKGLQAKTEAEPSTRANRRHEIRTMLLSANQRIAEIQKQLDTAAPSDEPPLLTKARRAELQVRRMLIESEQPALQYELQKYDAEDAADYLRFERDVRTLEVNVASAELKLLQTLLAQKREADSAAALERARKVAESTLPALITRAEENVAIAETAHGLTQPIEETRQKLESTKVRLEEVQKQYLLTQQRVNDIGLTGSIGALLRRQRVKLPDLRRRKQNVQNRRSIIEDAQYKLFEYDDLRSESIDASIKRSLGKVPFSDEAEKSRMIAAAKLLVEQRREYLNSVIRNYNAYIDTLFELDATEQRLIRETQLYEDYIDERVLWIRSNRSLLSSLELDASDTWGLDQERWLEVWQQLVKDFWANPTIYFVGLCAFVFLLWRKFRFRRELDEISQIVKRGACSEFTPTIRAALITVMLAIAWPGIFFLFAWRLSISSNGSQFSRAVAQALLSVAIVYFPVQLLRRVCIQRGLAQSHFGWPSSTIAVLRRNLQWASLLGLIVVFVTSLLYFSESEHGFDSIERAWFIVGMLILSVFLWRVLKPDTGVFRDYLKRHSGGWFDRLKLVWYWGCVFAPMLLAGMTIAGYYYTAQQLVWKFYASFVFVVAMQLLRAFLQRLLLVHRRAISIQQAKERRAIEAANREQSNDIAQAGPNTVVPIEESLPDVSANTEQSQRLIQTGLSVAMLVGMWLIWVDVLPALRILDQWAVWTTTVTVTPEADTASGRMPMISKVQPSGEAASSPAESVEVVRAVTLADIGLAILIGMMTIVCARNIPGLMEMSLLQRLPFDKSIRYAITSVTSYAIVLLGGILAFNAISVGWSKIQWLATALTFGLAFGMQEIFANFVAGLILLFERPIRVGDVVTVDDVSGVVSRIRIRATTITNWERKEYVIPNKDFITGRMLNWTLSDKTNRIMINVGVAYGSNVELAKELLLKICHDNPVVLDDPPTIVTFEGFGDNSLNLVVRTFLPDIDCRLPLIDQLHSAIDLEFRKAGIEIAFPQRDLHLRSVDQAVLSNLGQNSNQNKT